MSGFRQYRVESHANPSITQPRVLEEQTERPEQQHGVEMGTSFSGVEHAERVSQQK